MILGVPQWRVKHSVGAVKFEPGKSLDLPYLVFGSVDDKGTYTYYLPFGAEARYPVWIRDTNYVLYKEVNGTILIEVWLEEDFEKQFAPVPHAPGTLAEVKTRINWNGKTPEL